MAEFTYTCDYGISKSIKPQVTTVKFGDGYEARQAKGINTVPQSWSVHFNQREETESNAIEAFFVARQGVEAFDWTPPDSVTEIRVKCSEWNKTLEKFNRFSITCTFEQVFEPS